MHHYSFVTKFSSKLEAQPSLVFWRVLGWFLNVFIITPKTNHLSFHFISSAINLIFFFALRLAVMYTRDNHEFICYL